MKRRCIAPLAALFVLAACDPADDGEMNASGATGSSSAGTGDTEAPSTSGDTMDEGSGDTSSGGDESSGGDSSGGGDDSSGGEVGPFAWSELAGPCAGSATNAMWFDDPMTGFIGCGENASGEGLFTTTDGAATWEDNIRFNEVRIMDIRRGPDDVLYGAGIHQLDGFPLWSFDEGEMINATGLYDPSNTTSAVSQAENAAVTADGQILVDSLTGSAAAYRPAGGAFEELDSLSEELLTDPGAGSYQVRRILPHDNRFYAVGSLINDPARIHLPSQLEGATYHFHTVELQPETRDGELLDMYIWDSEHIIVAGHDQSERFPLIYLVDGADPYDNENWEKIELFDSGIDYQAGVNDIHVVGDTVVLAGEKIPTSGGFVVISEDGGRTYEDITPEGAGPLSAVWMFEDGQMVVAGGSGELWAYGPA